MYIIIILYNMKHFEISPAQYVMILLKFETNLKMYVDIKII